MTGLYAELEQEVINDIARRVNKTGRLTETAEIMARNLREQGFNTGQILDQVRTKLNGDQAYIKEVAENTKEYKEMVRELIKDTEKKALKEGNILMATAGDMAFNYDMEMWQAHDVQLKPSSTLTQLREAMARQTADNLRNITNSTGELTFGTGYGVLDEYQHQLDLATIKVCTGTFSYNQAVNDCVRNLAKNGLCVEYPSGRKYNLDTAARMAVRTASSQLAGRVTEMNMKNTGQALVYVDAHAGARPTHAEWQGEVYLYDMSQKDQYPKYDDFFAVTQYGDVAGLKGVNCTHDFYPYWEGDPIPEFKEPAPVTIDGKEYTYYEATQEQRRQERAIRQTKRELEGLKAAGSATDKQIGDLTKKLSNQVQGYKDFSYKANIRAKTERLHIESPTSRMANNVGAQWPSKGKLITAAEHKDLTKYANSKNVLLNNSFKNYDGDISLIKRALDSIEEIRKDYPRLQNRQIELAVSYSMAPEDYAITRGQKITINGFAYRNAQALEKDYQEAVKNKIFMQGTKSDAIIKHEMGHIYCDTYRINGMRALKREIGTTMDNVATEYIENNLSLYAAKYRNGSEIIPECFASKYGAKEPSQIALKIIKRCDSIIIERGEKL